MPIIEYRCDECGNQFEKLMRATSPAAACPGCGGEKLERQYSTFAPKMGSGAAKSAGACQPMPAGGCGSGMCGMPGVLFSKLIFAVSFPFPVDFRYSFAHTVGDMALTKRQKEVLEFLADFIETNRYSPSYEEIADGLKLNSLATIHKHISSLESKGYLRRAFNQSRSLEISPRYAAEIEKRRATDAGLAVPLLGKIAAGVPVEAVANQEMLHFQDFIGGVGMYALQVRGESMIEDHICNGDFVLIQKTDSVRDGETVVALVNGVETTLKRFYREPGGQVRLQPANSSMEPIYVSAANLQVQGKLVAVLRKY